MRVRVAALPLGLSLAAFLIASCRVTLADETPPEIWIAGGGTVVLKTRWCSGYARFHYTQTRFKLTDDQGGEFEVSGPWVRLLAS
ncbi:MAG: hypothetical protein HYY76_07570 [Acidobacteria bacterium]|nr:hypothetical protein [Acidobacteriota bacterium]